MTTTSQPARERILDAAERLVYQNGFNATTLDAILSDADASKGAFFHHFTGKEALGQALVARYAASDAALLDQAMAAAQATSDDPGNQALEFLRYFEQRAKEASSLHPGCLFVSFIYERGPGVPAADDVIVESILAWRHRLLDLLEKAVVDHPRLGEVDLESLADQVFTVFEGGFVLARATNDWSHLSRQLGHLRHYMELLLAD